MPADLIAGFLSGTVLIVAIGAQNSYVLRQGIRREHILPLVLLCASADALLIEGEIVPIEQEAILNVIKRHSFRLLGQGEG